MERMKVISYDPGTGYHTCIDSAGKKRIIDLYVDRKLDILPEDLVGREVEMDDVYQYKEIASGVKVL